MPREIYSTMHPRSRSGSVSSALSAPLPSPMSLRSAGGSRSNGLGPCGATPHLFLFAQGTSILCLQYESLALERRFEGHLEDVTIIAVDNTSDNEGEEGSRVVSVDASKLAIVWDTRTGHEIARYASFEHITSAAWMKNGNLAFGDAMGNVTLFDPLRSESISARTIFDPLCSIAPAADCKSFALGYANGSILVAALSPAFTILHTLTTTSLPPSPITALAWHASSSRQKSDMLATQTRGGDLRVWSIPKSLESDEPARVVRILKKPDSNNRRGDNWMAWSRNGRIVQYSDGETTIWDVRTKKVTWEKVPTFPKVFGMTVYGPKGVLFTLGEDHTVQQFSLYPPTYVHNEQHLPGLPPPSPPVSIGGGIMQQGEEQYHDHNVFHQMEEHEEDYAGATMSPLGRIAHELEQLEMMEHEHGGLGISNTAPRAASISSRSSSDSVGKGHNHNGSASSSIMSAKRSSGDHSELSHTTITTISPGRKASIGSTSINSPGRHPHPLRQEIYQSPAEEEKVVSPPKDEDPFGGLRARLVTATYESPRVGSSKGKMTEDDHRKEMLYCIFGWKDDIEDLITDQLDSVDSRSMSAIMLRMWLGDLDQNSLSVLLGADFMVAGDWMFLALSAMGGQKSWNHVVRAFVMRLLQRGDLHTAVLCLLALGDKNDAVEVYVSHKRYMEAVLLVSLLWKKDWKRQSQLVRKWGEHCAENADAPLAARCFACAGSEASAERLTAASMSRSHSRSKSETESIQHFVRSLSISAPSHNKASLRMTAKNSPLKLITAFPAPATDPIARSATTSPSNEGKMGGVQRFFAWAGDRGKTPVAATPIAMSAISPVEGSHWQRRDPFAAMSAKTVIPGAAKLPPVTEMSPDTPSQQINLPIEQLLPPSQSERGMNISSPLEARNEMGFSESRGPVSFGEHRSNNNTPVPGTGSRTVTPRPPSLAMAPAPPPPPPPPPPPRTLAALAYTQNPAPPTSQAPTGALPAPPSDIFNNRDSGGKGGHASRKPVGLAIQSVQWPPMDTVIREATPPISSGGSKHKRTGSRNTPPVASGRPPARTEANDLDGFLTLLDNVNNKRMDTQRAAPRAGGRRRAESPDIRGRDRSRNNRERSTDRRGRQVARQETPLMRSPSSPLPMSPQARLYREDVEEEDLHEADFEDERYYTSSPPPPMREPSRRRVASRSRQPSRQRSRQPSRQRSRQPSRPRSRQRSRGREELRIPGGSLYRSPSTPLPSSSQAKFYREEEEDSFDDERYYTASPPLNKASRARSRGRSHLRIPGQASHMRSPSSPLPMAPEALMYAEMAKEMEYEERQPRKAHRGIREESRNRLQGGGIRRSRSEATMRQWSDTLERAGALERAPSVSGMMKRNTSVRGLPPNPRAWRNEFGSESRAGSPAPAPRSASPAMSMAMAPAPPPPPPQPPQPFMQPGRAMSPAISTLGAVSNPRTMSPGPRQATPGPRTFTPGPRQNTPGPKFQQVPSRQMTPGPRLTPNPRTFSPPPRAATANPFLLRERADSDSQVATNRATKETVLRLQNHYYEEPDHYDATRKPILPDVPTIPFGGSHSRNNSNDPNFKPLIRKLPPQLPPDSPPPLPHDLPVHPLLNMSLAPSQPGRKGQQRVVRRQRQEEYMNPIDGVLRDHEQHITIGLDAHEAALRWEEENLYNQQQAQRYQMEMQQLRGHGASPSLGSQHSGHSGHGQSNYQLRDSNEAIGSINQF